MAVCNLCGASKRSAFNKPHSQHRTKTVNRINLQKSVLGLRLCGTCRRTLAKARLAQVAGSAAPVEASISASAA